MGRCTRRGRDQNENKTGRCILPSSAGSWLYRGILNLEYVSRNNSVERLNKIKRIMMRAPVMHAGVPGL